MDSNLTSISAAVSPSTEAPSLTFSRPVNCGLNPDPSSSMAAMRPRTCTSPAEGPERAANHLQQRGFARPVAADDADRLAPTHAQIHVSERPEFLVVAMPSPPEQLLEPIFGLSVDRIGLTQSARFDDLVQTTSANPG